MKRIIKVVCSALGIALGGVYGYTVGMKNKNREIKKVQELSDRHLSLFLLMNQWTQIKQDGKSIVEYLKKNNYNSIAIYGMSYVGETLLRECKDSEIKVQYAIDRRAQYIFSDIDIKSMEQELPIVDAIIVTAIYFYPEIKKELEEKVNCTILSLEDILYDL